MTSENPFFEKYKDVELRKQGAEARVYKAVSKESGQTVCIKERFSKKYRHPNGSKKKKTKFATQNSNSKSLYQNFFFWFLIFQPLDKNLRKRRTKAESNWMKKCDEKFNVRVPKILFIDLVNTVLCMEWIEFPSVKKFVEDEYDSKNQTYSGLPFFFNICNFVATHERNF